MSGSIRYWLVLVALPAVAWAGAAVKHVDDSYWGTQYDRYFRKYTKHYFGPHYDWRWFKAQGIAESGLDPNAESSVGARGIMQILPGTFEDIKKSNPHLKNIEDPKWNIAAGIFYDRQLYRKWRSKDIPVDDRLAFAFASYNAGYQRMLRVYKRAEKKHGAVAAWEQVEGFAPGQTRHYVRRINKLMQVGEE